MRLYLGKKLLVGMGLNNSVKLVYRPEIDGLRSVAVVSVVLFHAGFSVFSGGYVGVDVFFVISGYLITSIIMTQSEQGTFTLINFYERRGRRILPALFLVMLVSLPFAYVIFLPSDLVGFGESFIAIPLFISNILFWSERGYFDVATELKPLVHTWSLAVEEQFYLFFPVVFIFLFRVARANIQIVFITVIGLSLFSSWYLTKLHFETAFYLPISRAWELLVGGSAALVVRNLPSWVLSWNSLISVIGLILIGYSVLFFDSNTSFPGVTAIVPVLGAFLIVISSADGNFVNKLLSQKPLVYLGLISYSLYLWHQPAFAFIRYLELDDYFLVVAIFFVIGFSILSYEYVEKPFRDSGAVSRLNVFIFFVVGTVFFISIGIGLVYAKGGVSRFSHDDQKLLMQYSELDGYNQLRFDSLSLKSFSSKDKKKIFLVGDSHAKDFLNIMYEGRFEDHFEFSTKQINSECGNVYVDIDLKSKIPSDRRERCRVIGRYDRPSVKRVATAADEIWLVNYWKSWVVPYLPETVIRLEKEFGVKVRVFGIKNFGKISQRSVLSIPLTDRTGYSNKVNDEAISVNKKMRESVQDESYFEVLDLFCSGTFETCSIFTPDGFLISPDGQHLTKEGAKYLSVKIRDVLM